MPARIVGENHATVLAQDAGLATNTELTKEIHRLTTELHTRLVEGSK